MTHCPEHEFDTVSPGREREEPNGAFVYAPPSPDTRSRYDRIFALSEPLEDRPLKVVFDRVFATLALAAVSGLLGILYLASLIEGWLVPESRGDFFVSYNAVSRGRVFPKYKIRVIKSTAVDRDAAKRGEWQGYAAEWTPSQRTFVGGIVKRLYLDELPQLVNVVLGDMSMVGPRPLARHHYERDLAQGNVSRRVIKAGLLGPTQALKGSASFGSADVEYRYIEDYMRLSALELLWYDLTIIGRCLRIVFEAKGL